MEDSDAFAEACRRYGVKGYIREQELAYEMFVAGLAHARAQQAERLRAAEAVVEASREYARHQDDLARMLWLQREYFDALDAYDRAKACGRQKGVAGGGDAHNGVQDHRQ